LSLGSLLSGFCSSLELVSSVMGSPFFVQRSQRTQRKIIITQRSRRAPL
jgi:hypothetical protein